MHASPVSPAVGLSPESTEFFVDSLRTYRDAIIGEMSRIIAAKRFEKHLAHRLAEYPLRAGKGLRPALCMATCQALGGKPGEALQSAVALELYHNAFLVHDDIEDDSSYRRGKPTIHQEYGLAIAINVGDALSVLAMTPLLNNLRVVGLGRTLRIFKEFERMLRESVEGQAMELDWVSACEWRLTDRDYYVMTRKKTCWYTCITPCRIGAIIAGASQRRLVALRRFGISLGIAFQIQDDLLNLDEDAGSYGKETAGDIWEGKRTLMLIRLMQVAAKREQQKLVRIMSADRQDKTEADVRWVLALMRKYGCIAYGRDVCLRFATKAQRLFDAAMGDVGPSSHKRFLQETINYVIQRDH